MKRLLLIVNPVAGKMRIKSVFFSIVREFCDYGYDVCVKITKAAGDAIEFAYDAAANDAYDIIVCAGGDGTFNETLTGVLRSGNTNIELGYIPSGSTNDFANSLKIATKPLSAAVNIVKNTSLKVDVGKFNDRYFSYIASFGVFTAASYNAPQSTKNVFGHMTYIFEGIKDLQNIVTYHIKADIDGVESEDDYIFGSVSNSTSVAGVVKLNDELVDMSDGVFEVTLVRKPSNLMEFNDLAMAITSSDLEHCSLIDFYRGSNITIKSAIPIPWSLDGEYADGGTETHIENLHLAYSLRK